MTIKPPRKFFFIVLASLALILVAFYAVRWKIGQFAPDFIDKNLFNGVILVALGMSLWNRRIWSEEKRAAAEAIEKAAEGRVEVGASEAEGLPPPRKGGDAD